MMNLNIVKIIHLIFKLKFKINILDNFNLYFEKFLDDDTFINKNNGKQ